MEYNQLIIDVARCDEIEKAKVNENHSCHKIVEYQSKELGITNFQLAEPWNGDISKAEVLFISSNPSIAVNEHYPTGDWSNGEIAKFFTDRFDNIPQENYSHYWKSIFEWATWILPSVSKTEIHKHIAITEVVHCKSKAEYGVKDTCCFCAGKWFNKVLQQFNGKYIVVVGSTAKACFGDRDIQDKKIAFVPAPQARGYKDEQRRQMLLEQLL